MEKMTFRLTCVHVSYTGENHQRYQGQEREQAPLRIASSSVHFRRSPTNETENSCNHNHID